MHLWESVKELQFLFCAIIIIIIIFVDVWILHISLKINVFA